MKILIISDITLEALKVKKYLSSVYDYYFVFSEDLLSKIVSLDDFNSYDFIYVHFDSNFKKYQKEYTSLLLNAILSLSEKTPNNIALSNLLFRGWSEQSLVDNFGAVATTLNSFQSQIHLLLEKRNVFFLDLDGLIRKVGEIQTYNYQLGHLYQFPYTKRFLVHFGKYIEGAITKISHADKKVIILDCDNTLWGGIVGEDGVDGVLCDLNATGIMFYHFQLFIKSRKEMGFVLCLCSKNNESDVKEVFTSKRMPLQWDDFVVKKINWNNKDVNIREISDELCLGLESFVFIDDSDFEVNIVKKSLPEVSVFQMTTSYQDFINLTEDFVFTKKSISNEDLFKTDQYFSEALRRGLEQRSSNFAEYLKSLEIVCRFEEDLGADLTRVSQLTEKTNQFNFNKKPLSVEHIKDLISSGRLKCFTLRVSDKYGDYGLVGVALVEIQKNLIILDNFILSCRILGRRIEFDFFNHIEHRLAELYKSKIGHIRFQVTDKNIPAQKFYNQLIQET